MQAGGDAGELAGELAAETLEEFRHRRLVAGGKELVEGGQRLVEDRLVAVELGEQVGHRLELTDRRLAVHAAIGEAVAERVKDPGGSGGGFQLVTQASDLVDDFSDGVGGAAVAAFGELIEEPLHGFLGFCCAVENLELGCALLMNKQTLL